MKYNIFANDNAIYFAPDASKSTRAKNDGKIRLPDEAFEILDNIHERTGVSLSRIAAEMIRFAGDRVCILGDAEEMKS